MKKTVLTLCVIAALLIASLSFTLAFTQIVKNNAPGEDVESESTLTPGGSELPDDSEQPSDTEPAPVIKSFGFISEGPNTGSETITFQYEEGMSWGQWIESDYNDMDERISGYSFIASGDKVLIRYTYPENDEIVTSDSDLHIAIRDDGSECGSPSVLLTDIISADIYHGNYV